MLVFTLEQTYNDYLWCTISVTENGYISLETPRGRFLRVSSRPGQRAMRRGRDAHAQGRENISSLV